LLQTQLSSSTVNNTSAAAAAVISALDKGLLTASWCDLPAQSAVTAIDTLLLLQQQSSSTAAATAAAATGAAQSPQAELERLQKALLARAGELTVSVLLTSLRALLKSGISMHNATPAAAVALGALAQGLVAADWRSLPAASVVAAVNTLLSLHQRASTTAAAAAGTTITQSAPQKIPEDMQKALLTRIDELAPPVLLEALQTMLSSNSSGVGSATGAAAAVIGTLVNKLVASDWRTLPVASAKAAINTLLTLLQQWSTPSDTTKAAYGANREEVQRALLARVGELPAQAVLESLQALLNSNGGSSSSSSSSSSSVDTSTAAAAAVISALAEKMVAYDWRLYPAASAVAAINTVLSVLQRCSTTPSTTTDPAGSAKAGQLQRALLARIGGLTAPVLPAALQAVLSNTSGSSVSSTAAVIGALAQGLVAADWRTLSAQQVAAAVKALLQLHQQLPSQRFAADSTAAAAAAGGDVQLLPQQAAAVREIGTTDLLQGALVAVHRMPAQNQQPALTALLQLPALARQSATGVTDALRVAFVQLRLLYSVQQCKPVPALTWHQPAASCPGHPQLEQFFKGPQQVCTVMR
jgi:hypothetical protein